MYKKQMSKIIFEVWGFINAGGRAERWVWRSKKERISPAWSTARKLHLFLLMLGDNSLNL